MVGLYQRGMSSRVRSAPPASSQDEAMNS